jgi:dienelactone hydrolase
VSPDVFDDPPKRTAFSLPDFISRHSKAIRYPQIKEVAQILKSEYPKVGAIGYCYGGWAVFKLGGEPGLIDAASAAHPSLLTKDEISGIKVPVQILAAETDPAFTQELKKYSNKTLPTIGVPYEYIFFPKVAHGFAARGDPVDAVQREALERAKNSAVNFFKEFLL